MRKHAPGILTAVFALLCLVPRASSQPNLAGASEIQLALDRLNVNGAALMIAAHPDDENTALLAWLARGRTVRTAYLSITRGEGGQNLIGPEQGRFLGVIRTQELLEARRIDGARQFFTRAVDFGFTKSVAETLEKWGHDRTLSDIVWVIRKFQPNVIILRFSGTPRDGHGHHQTSAILGKEAFFAAADPTRFPEQLKYVKPWQAKRLLWNVFSFNRDQEREAAAMPGRIEVDLGEFNPVLGYSYSEIAGMSRSQHRSQGMGSPERRGTMKNFLVNVAGDPARSGLFDGISLQWPEPLAGILQEAAKSFDPQHPAKTVPLLLKARKLIPEERREEVDEAIALCTGLWLDASTDRPAAIAGSTVKITLNALNRSPVPIELVSTTLGGPVLEPLEYNQVKTRTVDWTATANPSEPLREEPEPDPVLSVRFNLKVAGEEISLVRPVWYRYVDNIRGERIRPFVLVPAVSVKIGEPTVIFPQHDSKAVDVQLHSYVPKASGTVRLGLPPGWKSEPEAQPFNLTAEGQEAAVPFRIMPPPVASTAEASAVASNSGKQFSTDVVIIDYPHIEPQTLYEPASAKLVRADVKVTARQVGYIMGAGDEIPDALRQIGCTVTLLTPEDLAQSDLGRFDAIVAGVRAYNTRPDLVANHHRVLDYIRNGGTYVVQYNVLDRREGLPPIGPYLIKIGRERVTHENSPVEILKANHPLLNFPNKITADDFEGWIQERGLYFASEWDPKYETIIATHDPNEKPLPGGMLYTRYGKGAYIFTAYSWFRELPTGVPGAYRIFANLLSAGDAP